MRNAKSKRVYLALVAFNLAVVNLLCLPLSLAAWSAPTNKDGTYKGWIISQESIGQSIYKFVITDDAIRLDSPAHGFSMIAKAPDWNPCVFRAETKEMGFLKFSQWQAWNTGALGTNDVCTLDQPSSKRRIQVRGIDAPTYQYQFPGEKLTTAILQTGKAGEISNYYVDTYQLSKAPQVAALQCQLFNCPQLDGLLIRCLGREKDTKTMNWFIRTRKLEPSNSIPASTFVPPKGYKILKAIDSQFKFKGMARSLDEFGDMLDLGEGRATKKPKP